MEGQVQKGTLVMCGSQVKANLILQQFYIHYFISKRFERALSEILGTESIQEDVRQQVQVKNGCHFLLTGSGYF